MRFYVFSVLALGLLLAAPSKAPALEPDASPARAAASQWLSKLDADQFSEAWELLSSEAKKGVSRWKWNLQCKMGRLSMGQARSRKEKSSEYLTKSPRGRAGEFILLKYETASEKKGTITEEVGVERDHDNQWRVCGYALGKDSK